MGRSVVLVFALTLASCAGLPPPETHTDPHAFLKAHKVIKEGTCSVSDGSQLPCTVHQGTAPDNVFVALYSERTGALLAIIQYWKNGGRQVNVWSRPGPARDVYANVA